MRQKQACAADLGQVHALSVFLTDLGWFGLVGQDGTVVALTIGHDSADAVRRALSLSSPGGEARLIESDWAPELRRRLEAFARGERSEFDDCRVALPALTPFQERVIAETRRLGWGSRVTYGELAGRAEAPRAARAVGSVMAANRIPIIIPCHRVVASGGGLGGYSAPQGIELKRRLLALEAAA